MVVIVLVAIGVLSVCYQHGMRICSGESSGGEGRRSLVVVVAVLVAIVGLSVCCQLSMGIYSGEASGSETLRTPVVFFVVVVLVAIVVVSSVLLTRHGHLQR